MDAITLAAIRRELQETILTGRVQALVQPDPHSLALEIYQAGQRHWLLLSAHPQWARIHLLDQKARRGLDQDTPFLLLARKHLRGSRLTHIIQPRWERWLYLAFNHPQHGPTTLVAEIMGRWSNLILHQPSGHILASLRHFETSPRARRIIRPGHLYQPPPPQSGKHPLDLLQETDLVRILHQTPAGRPLWKTLITHIAGISPLAAREIIYRATGDARADVTHPNLTPARLMDILHWFRTLPDQGGWDPSLALDDQDQPQAFAPYQLTHLPRVQPIPSISQAAQRYYQAIIGADSYAGRRQHILQLIQQARHKLLARRASLGEQAVGQEDIDRWREYGQWILAYTWKIQPGDTLLEADTGQGILPIPLDPALSPSENAQAYFQRYRKAHRAAKKIPQLLAQVDRDLAWLDQLEHDARLADNAPQLEEIRDLLLASGLIRETTPRKTARLPRSQPRQITTPEGFQVLIGRNALQNDHITWKIAQPDDLWFHARDIPGAHVILRHQGRPVPQSLITQVASWAAWHSKARHDTKVPVIVTQRRHLRKIKGGRPGQVRVLTHRTLTVPPQPPPQT